MDSLVYATIKKITEKIEQNKDFLTDLDREIGDGDHGINMTRGFTAVLTKISLDDDLDISSTLKKVGMTLLSTVGGASGPLYGSAFLKASAALKDITTLTAPVLGKILTASLTGIKERGKAVKGDKTMVDALEPACDAFVFALSQNASCLECMDQAIAAAKLGVEYTKSIAAKKGRASYLGARSIGHQDPGATSVLIILEAIREVINRKG
ncbi:dihydroxyacetone kinase subunit L [Sporanaerobium hydrogeniformans]|uniref:Dihydroxyacetone kinase subunit L n=1 Tax=Sporanaerobium hydrogeniformans TaxID=3072179 RepID=A0AC61DDB4_9FIRM|nr:dihydroxyacetone kinase subunit DhaL [Sporanaerobium hydrogeniformans]PHV70562.1 dihydroxyacetone kinase subunit L [Sporanaerobium hydrogeniformans]